MKAVIKGDNLIFLWPIHFKGIVDLKLRAAFIGLSFWLRNLEKSVFCVSFKAKVKVLSLAKRLLT